MTVAEFWMRFPTYLVDVTVMAWGEYRASAVKKGSFDRAIDGPYAETETEAIAGLYSVMLKEAPMMQPFQHASMKP